MVRMLPIEFELDMKLPSLTSALSATVLAAGISAIANQPGHAADYHYESDPTDSDDGAYTTDYLQLPDLEPAYRQDAPAYHYAYYAIARPEYLL